MTEITVNLVPRPSHTGLVLLHFDDLYAALEAVPELLTTGPTAIELLDTLSLTLCHGVPAYARLLESVVPGRLNGLPVFMAAGEQDTTVPPEESRRAAAVLRAAGADLDYREYPTEHKLTPAALDDLQAWLQAQR